MRRLPFPTILLLLVFALMHPIAYSFNFIQDIRNGQLLRAHWPASSQPVVYHFGQAGYDGLPGNREREIITEAFQVWTDPPEIDLSVISGGVNSATDFDMSDGMNTLMFVDYLPPNVLGSTRITAEVQQVNGTDALVIIDVDIAWNGVHFQFIDGPWIAPTTPSFKGLAVHEIGHLFGLNHSYGRESSMWYATAPDQDSLDTDDILGMATLYPSPGLASDTATVSGTVRWLNGSSNTGIQIGGNVVALDCKTGKAYAADMSRWASGQYDIQWLPPGEYALHCQQPNYLMFNAWEGNYYGNYVAGGFYPRCYGDGTENASAGHTFSVTAGQVLTGMDIMVVRDNNQDPFEIWPARNENAASATVIGPGSAVAAALWIMGDIDMYEFSAEAGQVVYFALESAQTRHTSPTLYPDLEPDMVMTVYDADGVTPIFESNDVWYTDPFVELFFRFPGDYYISIRDRLGRGRAEFDYVLTMTIEQGEYSAVPQHKWELYE
jgi:Matrixin